MGDVGDTFNAMRDERKALRWKFGIECPTCRASRPRAHATIMLPRQRCKVCGYVDRRDRLTDDQREAACEEYLAKHPFERRGG